MIENRKVYNIKIFNDEVETIIAILLERIRQLTIKLGEEEDDIKKTFIRNNIQSCRTIINRLDTGIIYNDEKYVVDSLDESREI